MPKVFSAVKAIILDKNKFLILKYVEKNFEIWDLPGGRIDYGESPYDTLHREVKEETNLDIEIIQHLGIWWFFRPVSKNQVICNTFLCQPKNDKVDLSKNPAKDENNVEFKWITKDEFLKDEYLAGRENLKKLISQL
jgi:8-oxo-dGTP diphosphatase